MYLSKVLFAYHPTCVESSLQKAALNLPLPLSQAMALIEEDAYRVLNQYNGPLTVCAIDQCSVHALTYFLLAIASLAVVSAEAVP